MCLIAVRGEEHKSRKISDSPHRAQSISRKSTERGKEKRKEKKEHEDAPSVSAEAVLAQLFSKGCGKERLNQLHQSMFWGHGT